MVSEIREYPVIWLQAATCSGCSVSVLNSVAPSVKNLLIDQIVPGKHVNLRFHATIMAASGEPSIEIMEDTAQQEKGNYILVVEGSVPTKDNGIYGSIGEREYKPVNMLERVFSLAEDAAAVICIGTCASFGGIFGAKPNPTGCKGVKEVLNEAGIDIPVINVPGCPPHPDWFVGTVANVLFYGLPSADEMDDINRLKVFYGELIHDNCPRRAFFDVGKLAKKLSDPGCLYELGCKGPVTYADCPIRQWNDGKNWCIKAGGPCMACVEPGFPDVVSPFYKKIAAESMFTIRKDSEGKLHVKQGLAAAPTIE